MKLLSLLTTKLRAEAGFLVLLAVAAVGAWIWVEFGRMRADRDDAVQRAEIICARAGADWSPTDKLARGVACGQRTAELARFKAETDSNSARLLADAMAQANARTHTDTLAARAAAEAARSAAIRMETADAEAERRNLVDREWFAAVNGVAGLRPPAR